MKPLKDPASFRDPYGYVFYENGKVYRYIGPSCLEYYDKFLSSELYNQLVQSEKLIPSEKCNECLTDDKGMVIRTEKIDFISYPYQWCFSQYKDAALLTLDIMTDALKHTMWLKDASAYNVQFHKGKAILLIPSHLKNIRKALPGLPTNNSASIF